MLESRTFLEIQTQYQQQQKKEKFGDVPLVF